MNSLIQTKSLPPQCLVTLRREVYKAVTCSPKETLSYLSALDTRPGLITRRVFDSVCYYLTSNKAGVLQLPLSYRNALK